MQYRIKIMHTSNTYFYGLILCNKQKKMSLYKQYDKNVHEFFECQKILRLFVC